MKPTGLQETKKQFLTGMQVITTANPQRFGAERAGKSAQLPVFPSRMSDCILYKLLPECPSNFQFSTHLGADCNSPQSLGELTGTPTTFPSGSFQLKNQDIRLSVEGACSHI